MRIISDDVKNIETYILNTEQQILQRANTKNVLQIGKETKKGLGAGADENVGEKAALESEEYIKNILKDTDMVFLTAGMGGGTGTGAIPVVARITKEMGILTVGIVTKPFSFEGRKRTSKAELGIEKLRKNVDSLIVVLNNNLLNVDRNITIENAFELADGILKQGIESITDLITSVGEINIDFADMWTLFEASKVEVKRFELKNLEKELKEGEIKNYKNIHIEILGNIDMQLHEVNENAETIQQYVNNRVNLIYHYVCNKEKQDIVKINILCIENEI